MQGDELDLGWEEEERPRHRRRGGARPGGPPGGPPGGKTKKKGSGGKTLLALLLSLVVLGGLGFGAYVGLDKVQNLFSAPDYDGGGSGEVMVEVLPDQYAADIGQTLQKLDVVKSAKAFVAAAKKNERSKTIQPGFYKLRKKMQGEAALALMLDPASRVIAKVTLPEGLTWKESIAKLAEFTKLPLADFEQAAKDPEKLGIDNSWFVRQDGKKVEKTLEGFLYPATYEFGPDVTAVQVPQAVIKKFNAEMTKIDFVDQVQQNLNISPFEALIAASIAQVEGLNKDQPGIVRVLYNRAYTNKFPCKCLGLDSTVNYWLRITGRSAKPSGDLLVSELHNKNNPYNTHDFPGMPIGPISNPGDNALKAAMAPPKHDFYYFMAVDREGNTNFAKTFADHEKNIKLAEKNGVQ